MNISLQVPHQVKLFYEGLYRGNTVSGKNRAEQCHLLLMQARSKYRKKEGQCFMAPLRASKSAEEILESPIVFALVVWDNIPLWFAWNI